MPCKLFIGSVGPQETPAVKAFQKKIALENKRGAQVFVVCTKPAFICGDSHEKFYLRLFGDLQITYSSFGNSPDNDKSNNETFSKQR